MKTFAVYFQTATGVDWAVKNLSLTELVNIVRKTYIGREYYLFVELYEHNMSFGSLSKFKTNIYYEDSSAVQRGILRLCNNGRFTKGEV